MSWDITRSHRRWSLGRATFGWHVYTQDNMTHLNRRLVIQPFLLWWLR